MCASDPTQVQEFHSRWLIELASQAYRNSHHLGSVRASRFLRGGRLCEGPYVPRGADTLTSDTAQQLSHRGSLLLRTRDTGNSIPMPLGYVVAALARIIRDLEDTK